MYIKTEMIFSDVLFVFLRDNERLYTCLLRAVGLFIYAADGTHAPVKGNLSRHSHILTDGAVFHRADDCGEDCRTCRGAVDISAAHYIYMYVVIRQILPGDSPHDRRRVEHGILRHASRGFVEAYLALSRFTGRKSHCLYLDDRADIACHSKAEDMSYLRAVRCLFRDELIKAADLNHSVDVILFNEYRLILRAPTSSLDGEAVGVGEDIYCLAAFYCVFAYELCRAFLKLRGELFRGSLNDFYYMCRCQRLKIYFRAA